MILQTNDRGRVCLVIYVQKQSLSESECRLLREQEEDEEFHLEKGSHRGFLDFLGQRPPQAPKKAPRICGTEGFAGADLVMEGGISGTANDWADDRSGRVWWGGKGGGGRLR